MANGIYTNAKVLAWSGSLNWTGDTIKTVLVDTALYTVNLSTHQYLSDVAVGSRVSTSSALTSKTNTAGTLDAADITHTAVSGASVEAVVVYKDTGAEATSPLLFYIDTGTNLPVTPNGGDITVQWNASGIMTW